MLESWGLEVDFGEHVFGKVAWLAGTDEERLADFNAALRDPCVRALFTAAGGKGSCRIADRLDFAAARSDRKFLVGISDITALQLSLWKNCRLVSVHGSFVPDGQDGETLRKAMMTSEGIRLHSRADEPTSALTTEGTARGRLIGGSLLPMSAVAGWALPSRAILLIEAGKTSSRSDGQPIDDASQGRPSDGSRGHCGRPVQRLLPPRQRFHGRRFAA